MQARRSSPTHICSNKLLAHLPAADYRRISSALEPVSFSLQHVLLKPGDILDRIYFPGEGVCSITQVMRKGRTFEVATVGNEGFIGVNALFGGGRWLAGVLVKIPDNAAHAMSIDAFRRELNRRGAFTTLANHYARRFVASLMRSAACNALHSVNQRCARWLLTTRDHVGRNEFPLTQEFLARMLGVRRPSVTLSLAALQRRHLIEYGRRRVVILDRRGLQAVSCECYSALKSHFVNPFS
jgi:CRP-like cAMP-binding protein